MSKPFVKRSPVSSKTMSERIRAGKAVREAQIEDIVIRGFRLYEDGEGDELSFEARLDETELALGSYAGDFRTFYKILRDMEKEFSYDDSKSEEVDESEDGEEIDSEAGDKKSSKKLVYLNLSRSVSIQDRIGMQSFISLITQLQDLEFLYIANCEISADLLLYFVRNLASHKTLLSLDLSRNERIPPEQDDNFIAAFKECKSLMKITLPEHSSPKLVKAVEEIAKRNLGNTSGPSQEAGEPAAKKVKTQEQEQRR